VIRWAAGAATSLQVQVTGFVIYARNPCPNLSFHRPALQKPTPPSRMSAASFPQPLRANASPRRIRPFSPRAEAFSRCCSSGSPPSNPAVWIEAPASNPVFTGVRPPKSWPPHQADLASASHARRMGSRVPHGHPRRNQSRRSRPGSAFFLLRFKPLHRAGLRLGSNRLWRGALLGRRCSLAVELVDALALHLRVEHFQGSAAGVDLIIMR
jgi:hypothetical protein